MTAPMKQHEAILTDWSKQLTVIRSEVCNLYHHRQIWEAMLEAITTRAAETPGIFLQHYASMYVTTQTMGIRRLARAGSNDPDSLKALIEKILRNRNIITRTWFSNRYATSMSRKAKPEDCLLKEGKRIFDKNWGCGGELVATEVLQKDIKNLDTHCERAIELSDNVHAHINRTFPKSGNSGEEAGEIGVTFKDLDLAINTIGDFVKRFAILIVGNDLVELAPIMQWDWSATFQRALFPGPPDYRWPEDDRGPESET